MNTLTGEVLTLPKMSGSVLTPQSLIGNVGAKTINIGGKGDDGATFIPSVSVDGVISWTNDKELPNPEPMNIKGAKGDKGDKGEQGQNGADGTSATHRWSGTTLYITSASGTSSANLKGDKGDAGENGKDGAKGKDGTDGYTPVKGIDYFTEADKSEMVSSVIAALPVYDGGVTTV